MAEKQISGRKGSIFDLDGVPPLRQALPLAIQHVVAMIVGCVTPAILVSNAAGLAVEDRVLLIQAALVIAALSTFIQLFPIFGVLGSRLPMIMGVSFAYVPSLVAVAGDYDVATIFGAQIVGGVVAILVGLFVKKLRGLFPPLITGTVVFTIGLSLYPTAVNYMAGGTGNTDAARLATPALLYGSWQNWMIAILTLIAVTVLNHYAKGLAKLASILLGMAFGYVVAAFFGMVDLSPVAEAGFFQLPKIMHFGISFDISACTAIGILFAINSIQAIGDYTATTIGGMDREPTDGELQRGIVAYGASNILGAVLGGLPTATYSQNVGIVVTTKVINRIVLGMAAALILLAGLVPKFSAILTTIPQCVLGGATISVFASIAMTGMKLVTSAPMNYRNTSIVGLAAALGMGVSQASASLSQFPDWATTIFGKSPVVVATIVAIILNIILPKEEA
ncbi:purine permease [Cuneatibacter sp. NSJ-177]|uniref:uracil-xanthine permease family protein n=1 Tax=Cuneatibacter sp. NSJ-177 TaxID=2931401 RepID=UPI001FD49302|nr:nucleobase:cation symporter-2 family protein [Cuneatibacter sp. NSJ-177]MCJ7834609.1 purine permease [Cuneatibacter sp. NSJ-177]